MMAYSLKLQQIIGVLSLVLPVVIAYSFFPRFVLSAHGIIIIAFFIGLYVAFATHTQSIKLVDSLKFVPAEQSMSFFQESIELCNMQSANVQVRYAYSDDKVATTTFSTTTIDPTLWKGFQDAEFFKVRDILVQHVLPALPENKKQFQKNIAEIMTPEAQRFIFKHELGHVFHNYTKKYVFVVGLIGFFAALAGLLVARVTIA